jgi:hypothetical protein
MKTLSKFSHCTQQPFAIGEGGAIRSRLRWAKALRLALNFGGSNLGFHKKVGFRFYFHLLTPLSMGSQSPSSKRKRTVCRSSHRRFAAGWLRVAGTALFSRNRTPRASQMRSATASPTPLGYNSLLPRPVCRMNSQSMPLASGCESLARRYSQRCL